VNAIRNGPSTTRASASDTVSRRGLHGCAARGHAFPAGDRAGSSWDPNFHSRLHVAGR
jgi:hypothetical protein